MGFFQRAEDFSGKIGIDLFFEGKCVRIGQSDVFEILIVEIIAFLLMVGFTLDVEPPVDIINTFVERVETISGRLNDTGGVTV